MAKGDFKYSSRVFSCYKWNGCFWFRIFGVGLSFKDTSIHGKFFSERYGYTKHIMIGKWLIKIIK